MTCPFCRIAAGSPDAVMVHEDADVVAFLDIAPIRPGHAQVVPRTHVESFERLPPALAARILAVGQALARRMKRVYGVDRVAFLFTGGDVPHVHAHVVPLHAKTDITSLRYLREPQELALGVEHLKMGREALERVRAELAFDGSEEHAALDATAD